MKLKILSILLILSANLFGMENNQSNLKPAKIVKEWLNCLKSCAKTEIGNKTKCEYYQRGPCTCNGWCSGTVAYNYDVRHMHWSIPESTPQKREKEYLECNKACKEQCGNDSKKNNLCQKFCEWMYFSRHIRSGIGYNRP